MTAVDGDDRTVATAMFKAGKAMQLQHDGSAWAQALTVYDDLIARFRHSHDPAVARMVGNALTWGAHICTNHVSPERALARYQEVIDLFMGRPEGIFRRNLAVAWGGMAIVLDNLDRTEERLQILAELPRRIDYRPWDLSEDETVVSQELAKGALNYGCTLEEQGRNQEAMAVWRELISCFGNDQRPSVMEFVAWAGTNLGNTLKNAKQPDEAAAQWNYVVTQFAGIDDAYLQQQVDRARQSLKDLTKPRWRPW